MTVAIVSSRPLNDTRVPTYGHSKVHVRVMNR